MIFGATANFIRSIGPRFIAIFVAAACLGGVFNALSPLGVGRGKDGSGTTEAPTFPGEAPAKWLADTRQGKALPSMTWPQVKSLLLAGKAILVDARELAVFQGRHIPGAISLPAGATPADMQKFISEHPKTTTIIVYCASATCHASQVLGNILPVYGFTDVREMPGGYAEWRIADGASNPAAGGGK